MTDVYIPVGPFANIGVIFECRKSRRVRGFVPFSYSRVDHALSVFPIHIVRRIAIKAK